MPRIVAIVVGALYFAGVLAGTPAVEASIRPWFLAAWSAAYVCCYLKLAHGRPRIAISWVVVVTLLLPVVALISIALPLYHSLPALFASLWSEFRERGPLRVVELMAPLLVALACVRLIGQSAPDAARR